MQEVIGYICFVLIGFILAVIGGGGSMLAVPILVYLFNLSAQVATGYSLFIVGLTSLIGSFSCLRRGDFKLEALYLFAIPSLISIFCTRYFIMPALPQVLFSFGSLEVTKDSAILLVFSFVVLMVSVTMISKKPNADRKDLMWSEFFKTPLKIPFIMLLGIIVGFISGFVGAGGGFMIIPVLVIFLRMPMKKAIGTSLIIIAVNSLIGFAGNIGNMDIDWKFLALVSSIAVAGIFAGGFVAAYIPGKKLKPAFGWFSLMVGVFILIKEIFIQK
jgi:uncharacterized protein